MNETEFVERLERLERAHRRLKSFALAALVLATALTTIHATQPVPQKITAHEFDVLDDSGKVRTTMTADVLALFDAQGKGRVAIHLSPDGSPMIGLLDAQGKLCAVMSASSAGSSGIGFSDAQGKGRAAMELLPDGSPSITLADAQGKPRVGMSLLPNGEPNIKFSDSQGFEMDLGTTQTAKTQQTSAASIVMFGNGNEHRVIWQAP